MNRSAIHDKGAAVDDSNATTITDTAAANAAILNRSPVHFKVSGGTDRDGTAKCVVTNRASYGYAIVHFEGSIILPAGIRGYANEWVTIAFRISNDRQSAWRTRAV